jgi:hypothetical protein
LSSISELTCKEIDHDYVCHGTGVRGLKCNK